jgi:hypothetical protein
MDLFLFEEPRTSAGLSWYSTVEKPVLVMRDLEKDEC